LALRSPCSHWLLGHFGYGSDHRCLRRLPAPSCKQFSDRSSNLPLKRVNWQLLTSPAGLPSVSYSPSVSSPPPLNSSVTLGKPNAHCGKAPVHDRGAKEWRGREVSANANHRKAPSFRATVRRTSGDGSGSRLPYVLRAMAPAPDLGQNSGQGAGTATKASRGIGRRRARSHYLDQPGPEHSHTIGLG
jgi:hypothetical protein